ncbi:hypothetical protein JJL56_30465 [Azospirillum sp. YIM DDC1]|uniref:Class I SAM-dependent methyltransferase n=1 Tax=Azospirillum aestuarii TaxID=2802052 RepID=A0ABS1I7Z0_9PROT|nr:hypothetical protein [Azospirillum aestuarii]MBK4723181.1 hypothetical protein [Azospirillum aestuarii]
MTAQGGLMSRTALLRELGIEPAALAGRRVLDVTGHADIPATRPEEPFGVVLCDRLAAEAPNPEDVLARLSGALAPGGLLVVGCGDHLLQLPGTVRRLMARLAGPDAGSAVTPPADPRGSATVAPVINFPETVAVLAPQFLFHAAAPSLTDDSAASGGDWGVNATANDRYWRRIHALLDPRHPAAPRPTETNQRLYGLCTRLRAQVAAFERTGRPVFVERAAGLLADIVEDARGFAPVAAAAFGEALAILNAASASGAADPRAIAAATSFAALRDQGRERIHLSFTKNAPAA